MVAEVNDGLGGWPFRSEKKTEGGTMIYAAKNGNTAGRSKDPSPDLNRAEKSSRRRFLQGGMSVESRGGSL